MKKRIIGLLILYFVNFLSTTGFSQNELHFNLRINESISPNLGLSEDTLKFGLTIEKFQN
jgi:hypothetical protein